MVTLIQRESLISRLTKILAVIVAILVFPAAFASAAEVEARLDRDSVAAGNGAILTLTISGGRPEQVEIPEIENLIVQSRGQNHQFRSVNGITTESVIYKYVVGSHTPGDYQIPPIAVTVDGSKFSTQPLNLKVLGAGAAQPPAGSPPAAEGTQDEEADADTSEKRFGSLTVQLAGEGRKHAYVGEIAPVIIRAWFPEESRAQLRSGIQPEGKGFTLHNVSEQPQQNWEIKDGKRYLVVTWYGGISATKPGKLPASLSVDATVAIRDPSARKPQRRRMGGPFDDPFFHSVFENLDVPMIQKDVTLKSDDQEIEVRPLPAVGRPPGFSGAVGNFKFDSANIPGEWKTGEPQQITTRLSGSGNFALLNAPELTPAGAWKSYQGKDEFTPGDRASFSGSKIFQFSAVPKKGGPQDVSLTFSYFDPAAEAYKTLASPVLKIQVAGKDLVDAAPAPPATAKDPEKKSAGLIGQHLKPTPSRSLVPLVSRREFVPMLTLSAILVMLGQLLTWLRHRREDPKRRALAAMEKGTREALAAAGQCAAAEDVSGYFSAARLAIQHRLGALWNQAPQAITLAEISARLPEDSPAARFFREADRLEYGRPATGEILPQWRALLDEAIASLTPTSR